MGIAIAGAGLLLSGGVMAASGTITISGKVIANTCTTQINGTGTGDGTVTLPDVATDLLDSGESAGMTGFTIDVTDCTNAIDSVKAAFEPTNVDLATGNLKNIAATTPATNVEVQILDQTGTVIDLVANDSTALDLPDATKEAHLHYAAQYVNDSGAAAAAGNVESQAVYSISYE